LNEKRKPVVFSTELCSSSDENQDDQKLSSNANNSTEHRNGYTVKNGYHNALRSTFEMRTNQNKGDEENETFYNNQLPEKAMEWKRDGNDYFSDHNYFQAVVCYNKALELCPDSSVLYANRAAALLRREW